MKISKLLLPAVLAITLFSCDVNNSDPDNDTVTEIENPATYEFTRNGESTVSFSGQTTRIKMGKELFDAMSDFDNTTEESILEMYRNQDENGNEVDPFSESRSQRLHKKR